MDRSILTNVLDVKSLHTERERFEDDHKIETGAISQDKPNTCVVIVQTAGTQKCGGALLYSCSSSLRLVFSISNSSSLRILPNGTGS